LLAAYARQKQVVDVDMVDEIATYYRLQCPPMFLESKNGHRNDNNRGQAPSKSLLDVIERMERAAAALDRN